MAEISRCEKKFREEIVPECIKILNLKNVMEVPKLEKIVINMGVGDVRENAKVLDNAMRDLSLISGQKPIATKSKKSISNFKIREGWKIGTKVTLRRRKMYDFLDRFINVVIPRKRDFRGLSTKSFDGRGNFSIGLNEQTLFPEIHYDDIDKVRGMDITIVTTAKTDREALALLKAFGMPFKEI